VESIHHVRGEGGRGKGGRSITPRERARCEEEKRKAHRGKGRGKKKPTDVLNRRGERGTVEPMTKKSAGTGRGGGG